MAKVNLSKTKLTLKEIKQKSNDKALFFILGKMARDIIFRRVKSGKGVSDINKPADQVNLTKLKSLSPNYIKFRKKFPPKGEFATARKSNLTYTGELLKEITFVTQQKGFRLVINSSIRSRGLTNDELATYVQKDRPFFNLAKNEIKIIKSEYLKRLRGIVTKSTRR